MTTKTYYVTNYPLHKIIKRKNRDGKVTKSTQTYMPGDELDLTDEEAIKYQHLIETDAQMKSRQTKTSQKSEVKSQK